MASEQAVSGIRVRNRRSVCRVKGSRETPRAEVTGRRRLWPEFESNWSSARPPEGAARASEKRAQL